MVKKIHYCWFGGAEKSPVIKRCIDSWKKYFPDWKIIEWNESNFNVKCNLYVRQAYEAKKWAFVSDYARFFILEKYGGLYFDTDVEVIRKFDDILNNDSFAGFETDKFIAPGLVLYCKERNNHIMTKVKDWYDNARFLDENGERIKINVCGIFTNILNEYGFIPDGTLQTCGGMTLYPKDYFCPFDDATGVLKKTENTYSIHWYDKSWMSKRKILRNKVTRMLHRWFGTDIKDKIKRIFIKK